jgi:hypothetical protein
VSLADGLVGGFDQQLAHKILAVMMEANFRDLNFLDRKRRFGTARTLSLTKKLPYLSRTTLFKQLWFLANTKDSESFSNLFRVCLSDLWWKRKPCSGGQIKR